MQCDSKAIGNVTVPRWTLRFREQHLECPPLCLIMWRCTGGGQAIIERRDYSRTGWTLWRYESTWPIVWIAFVSASRLVESSGRKRMAGVKKWRREEEHSGMYPVWRLWRTDTRSKMAESLKKREQFCDAMWWFPLGFGENHITQYEGHWADAERVWREETRSVRVNKCTLFYCRKYDQIWLNLSCRTLLQAGHVGGCRYGSIDLGGNKAMQLTSCVYLHITSFVISGALNNNKIRPLRWAMVSFSFGDRGWNSRACSNRKSCTKMVCSRSMVFASKN